MTAPAAFGRRAPPREPPAPAATPRPAAAAQGPSLKTLGLDGWSSLAGESGAPAARALPWRWIGFAAGVVATVGAFFVDGRLGDVLQWVCGGLTVAAFFLKRRRPTG